MRRVAVSLLLVALVACEPSVPQGRFACDTDEDCPDEMVCRTARGRCYATQDDAGSDHDAGRARDAGRSNDAGRAMDAGAHDASTPEDAGADGSPGPDAGPDAGRAAPDASTGAP